MSQETIQITPRNTNQNVNGMRREGTIPGIMYGQSLTEALPIQMPVVDLQHIVQKGTNTTTFIANFDGQDHTCILRDYQTDALHTKLLHVDLQYVRPDECVKMTIPLNYQGMESLSAKKLILDQPIAKLPIKGMLKNLPETFVSSVKGLERGDRILAGDIVLPEGTELLVSPDVIVAIVQ